MQCKFDISSEDLFPRLEFFRAIEVDGGGTLQKLGSQYGRWCHSVVKEVCSFLIWIEMVTFNGEIILCEIFQAVRECEWPCRVKFPPIEAGDRRCHFEWALGEQEAQGAGSTDSDLKWPKARGHWFDRYAHLKRAVYPQSITKTRIKHTSDDVRTDTHRLTHRAWRTLTPCLRLQYFPTNVSEETKRTDVNRSTYFDG